MEFSKDWIYSKDYNSAPKSYEGEWGVDGPEGYGEMLFKDETIYKGYFQKGKFHGTGILELNGENIYQG